MSKHLITKVCGMTQAGNIRQVEALGIDLMGFIFYAKSPRCVCEMPDYLPQRAKRVGVFVNESKENVLMYADRFGLDYVQLHGHESPDYVRSLLAESRLLRPEGVPVIKAFSVGSSKDLRQTEAYEGLCSYLLFDTKTPKFGGSGNQFDWGILDDYAGETPFLLSGGIGPYSAGAIAGLRHPRLAGIDLNSRFETAPGMKDVGRLESFLRSLDEQSHYQP